MFRIYNTLDMLDLINELEFYAFHDPLTGLYNRRYFFEEVPKFFSLAKRQKLKVACLMLDIDNFKKINDTFGHEVGDLVLRDLAEKLKETFKRREDLVARFGGEEFVVLTNYNDESSFKEFIENFRIQVWSSSLNSQDLVVKYSVSIGCELHLKETLREMLSSADEKLYKAKKSGKNCIIFE